MRHPKADPQLMAAVEEAANALRESVDPSLVGDHIAALAEDERVVTHLFASADPGYVGWRWAVTITRAPRQKAVTVNEIVLLPGESAVTPPEWVPWKDRMAPEDLRPGDLIPVAEDDARLVPGYLVGDAAVEGTSARERREVISEVGLGREWVLSLEGRDEAAERWYEGQHGPDDPIAREAPGRCGTCGFLVRISGLLAQSFGVCANVYSPSDGHAVSFDHGCGAHSSVREQGLEHQRPAALPFHDTLTFDALGEGEFEIIR